MNYLSGFHAIEEQLRSKDQDGLALLVGPKPGPRVKRILEDAAKSGVTVRTCNQAELDRLCPDNRGMLMAMEGSSKSQDVDLDSFCAALIEGQPALVLVLDHLEDPHNLGAVLRSADVFGVNLVVLPERRAAKETDAVARTSAGASAWVPMASVLNVVRAIERLKEAGFWTYAADMGGVPVRSADLPDRIALVLGAEGSGVSRLVKERCDGVLSIPQKGHVDSLNVSVAAGIFMYELDCRRK